MSTRTEISARRASCRRNALLAASLSLASAALITSCGGAAPTPREDRASDRASPRAEERDPECEPIWLHLPVTIQFEPEGSTLDARAMEVLREVVATVRSRAQLVRVEGHGFCAPREVGMELSEARAEVVALALVELGLPADRVTRVAYGLMLPRADECWELRPNTRTRGAELSILACPSARERSSRAEPEARCGGADTGDDARLYRSAARSSASGSSSEPGRPSCEPPPGANRCALL